MIKAITNFYWDKRTDAQKATLCGLGFITTYVLPIIAFLALTNVISLEKEMAWIDKQDLLTKIVIPSIPALCFHGWLLMSDKKPEKRTPYSNAFPQLQIHDLEVLEAFYQGCTP